MSINPAAATNAYAAAARVAAATPLASGPAGTDPARATDFAALVKTAAANAASTIRSGEAAMLGAANGKAGLVEVTTAVAAAEIALETAIAVRNRVVEAYQEIMRMPI